MEQVILVQISDVHFGSNLLNGRFGWIGGYRAHDRILCCAFSDAVRDLRKEFGLGGNAGPFFLLTGDLTASGIPGEFSTGHLFLRGERPVDFDYPLSSIGLRLAHSQLSMIPGNHDHWDGTRLPAGPYNPEIFGRDFRTTPWKLQVPSDKRQLVVELLAVDSNSGMKKRATLEDRIRARGRISDEEFEALEILLRDRRNSHDLPSSAKIVRAIVVHHPLSINSRIPMLDAQPLDADSRDRLLQLSMKYDVFAILNGHTHRFYFEGFRQTPKARHAKVWEMRCGTTLQGPAKENNQGFLVHQVVRGPDDGLSWNVWLYRWGADRFVRPDGGPWLPLKVP